MAVAKATIASGQTTSGEIDLKGGAMVGIITPSALTSTTMTFTASDKEGGTFVPVYDSEGNQINITVAASQAIALTGVDADALAPWSVIKLVGGSAEGADRTIYVKMK